MLPSLPGSLQQYLVNLQQVDTGMTNVTQELSSGLRVSSVADDPSAVPGIMQAQSQIDHLNQTKTNLTTLQPELQSGDAALQQAMQNVESAISIASQASSPMATASSRAALATQVQGILQNLVQISNTTVQGNYIFSGDLVQQPLYQLDPTQPTGVKQLATAQSTRVVTDANGVQVWLSKTASEIFDDRNPDTTPASDNVFAAVNSLLTALQSPNPATAVNGALASISNLKAADSHLNQELGYYGIGEARVNDALTQIGNTLTSVESNLSTLRDANVASAAVELNQLTVQQQAALSARAKMGSLDLFQFLG